MMKVLAVLPVTLLACTDASMSEPIDDTPATPIAPRAIAQVADAPVIVATGGVAAFAIDDPSSVGWYGDATTGFAVEPFDADGWPNTQRAEYWVRALASGNGSFTIQTNHGIAAGSVLAAPLAGVALVPADYELDGHSAFAVDATRPLVQATLVDAQGRRLVDATLVLGGSGATQTAWDRVTLAAEGRATLDASADSFASRSLAIDVVAGYDRTETVTVGGRTCVHAYKGDVEIATTMDISANGGTLDPHATNCVTR